MRQLTPQERGRMLAVALADAYQWQVQRGSGNQWHHPSDAWNALYQIEIKTVSAQLPSWAILVSPYWTKLRQESAGTGRVPLLVVASALYAAWGIARQSDAEALGLAVSGPVCHLRGRKTLRVNPAWAQDRGGYQVHLGDDSRWTVAPLDRWPGIRAGINPLSPSGVTG